MGKIDLGNLTTECQNENTTQIDQLPTLEMVRQINAEDKRVPLAIEKTLPEIAKAIDAITERLQGGGRLFYIGAGTSGRLGVLDAVECPPTFSTAPELIQGIIAGGQSAMFEAQEGAEDAPMQAVNDLTERNLNAKDIVVGLAASGRTPYVIGGLEFSSQIGADTIAVTCNSGSKIAKLARIAIVPIVGAEVITGSTRLKSGTAQKLVLNMLSTGTMIKLGKVYGNLMVDVKASNLKLQERACRIIEMSTGASRKESEQALEKSGGSVKLAIFFLLSGLPLAAAKKELEKNHGYIAKALQNLLKEKETK